MNTTVTQKQKDQFRTDGYVVLENFLSGDELATWRTITDEAVEQRLAGRSRSDPDAYYAQVFTQCLRMADTHAGISGLVKDPRLGEVAAALMGVDGARLWHDQALIKPPYGNQTSWHLDTPYWAFESPETTNFWFALDDATLQNGCLWYLPGTHRLASYELVRIGENMADLFKLYPEWRRLAAVPTPCPAGSVVIHNGLVAHAAGPNMTARPRRAMTSVYFPEGTLYKGQPDTLPEVYYRTLQKGDRLNDDRYVPLVWHK